MTSSLPTAEAKTVSRGMRWWLIIMGVLALIAGIQLFFLTEQTDRLFAWTISSRLTAAFLGATYWAGALLAFLSAREKQWARARLALPTILVASVLLTITTLIHFDRFHLADTQEPITRLVTWAWIAAYIFEPVIMLVMLVREIRAPGSEPEQVSPLRGWVDWILRLQGPVLLVIGTLLLLSPETVAPVWPWTLTPLTGRAIGAWIAGIGVAAALMSWENDNTRIRSGLLTYSLFVILNGIALARYSGEFNWSSPAGWLFLLFLASMLVVGVAGFNDSRRGFQNG